MLGNISWAFLKFSRIRSLPTPVHFLCLSGIVSLTLRPSQPDYGMTAPPTSAAIVWRATSKIRFRPSTFFSLCYPCIHPPSDSRSLIANIEVRLTLRKAPTANRAAASISTVAIPPAR